MTGRTPTLAAGIVALWVGSADAQHSRPAQPKPKAPEPVATTLFEQEGVPYVVAHVMMERSETCAVYMGDKPRGTMVGIETNAGDRTMIVVQDRSDPRPAAYAKPGARLRLRVETDGVAQTYSARTLAGDDAGWAEVVVPRAALRHLQAAVNNRAGLTVTVGDMEPMRFTMPPRAADAWHECGRGLLRGRLDGMVDRLNRN